MHAGATAESRSVLWPVRLLRILRSLKRSSILIVLLGLLALAGQTYVVAVTPKPLASDGAVRSRLPLVIGGSNILIIAAAIALGVRQIRRTRDKLIPLGYPLLDLVEHHRGRDIWRSVEPLTKRPVNIHVIHPEKYPLDGTATWKTISHQWVKRGERAKKLTSPHIARLIDCGFADEDSFYAVMELPRGICMYDLVTQYGPCPLDRSLFLLAQAAHAVQEAHTRGLCNLSLRPQHIWVGTRASNADWVTVELFGYEIDDTAAHLTRNDVRDFIRIFGGILTGRWIDPGDEEVSVAAMLSAISNVSLPFAVSETIREYINLNDKDGYPPVDELVRRMWSSQPTPTWNNDRADAWWREHAPVNSVTP